MDYHVIVVGAGGTGGFFLKEFGRVMSNYQGEKRVITTVVDGDHVERKNLERQAFSDFDIDKNKAVSIVAALKECFGMRNIYAYPAYIDTEEDLYKIVRASEKAFYSGNGRNPKMPMVRILIGAVDNHRARQVFHKIFKQTDSLFYFDAANEYEDGEVVFSGKVQGKELAPPRAYYFPGILKSRAKRASELSCGAVNISAPQHLVTNMLAGNILLSKTVQLIMDDKVELGIAYFNAFKNYCNFYEYSAGNGKSK